MKSSDDYIIIITSNNSTVATMNKLVCLHKIRRSKPLREDKDGSPDAFTIENLNIYRTYAYVIHVYVS